MTRALLFRLGIRLLARDWRAGELRLLVVSLVIAVGAVTAIGFFTERLRQGMAMQSADLLGADLVVRSTQPIDETWLAETRRQRLHVVAAVDFASVAVSGERVQLSSIRAVAPGYPLRGVLNTAPTPYAQATPARDIPSAGRVWADVRLAQQLDLPVGGVLEIGHAKFTVERILVDDPGRGLEFLNSSPRVLMNLADVPATGVVQPGSRVSYKWFVAGAEDDVRTFREWLTPRLTAHHQLSDPRTGNATLGRALDRVDRYLGLTSLLAVLLAGVAVAASAQRYSVRHYDLGALLRCFGAAQQDVLWLVLPPLLVLGLIGAAVGGAIGWFGQEIIYVFLKELFPVPLPAPGVAPLGLGLMTGLILLSGFAVPPLLRLRRVPVLRVLRRELVPVPASGLTVYGSAAIAMLVLMWWHTDSWLLTAAVLLGSLGVAALLAVPAYGLLSAGRRLSAGAGAAWRFGLSNLWRRAGASVGQLMAFGVTLMAMGLILLVRTDLLASWQGQLPADTPNHFAFNVQRDEVSTFRAFFSERQLIAQQLYPMVRGRLTHINGVTVTQAVSKESDAHDTILRELNLTWSEQLPRDNRVVSGDWPGVAAEGATVSVEERLARRLGVGIGDRLSFSIGGESLEAHVASLRKVQWDSFHPNFYMIFPPGVLDPFPATYLTSFYLAPAQKSVLADLVRSFPSVSVLETDQILTQVRKILRQVTAAVEFLLLFVLAAGLAVLAAALSSSLDERLREGALLRALGASRRQLRAGQVAEFAALGFFAGVLAAAGVELIAAVLYVRVFDLEYGPKWIVWVLAPLVGMVTVTAAGALGTARVLRQSPLTVLRES